ncbi:MAG: hypothetical protein K8H86_08910 [Ignavibacteriaceae bacterium]|nr:hypothetical protein [Ignavibacteriaceae bacterium]
MNAQNISGTIYFYDGSLQNFSNINAINGYSISGEKLFTVNNGKTGIRIYYNDSPREIPFSDIKYLHIKNINRIFGGGQYNGTTVEIKTKTGMIADISIVHLNSVSVSIFDEFTGNFQETQINYGKLGTQEALIKRIEFDNH